MSPYGYVQVFLFGLFCTAPISAETATCTSPRAQSNIDLNQVYGDWFLGKAHGPYDINEDKSACQTMHFKKINETTLELTYPGISLRKIFSIRNVEDPGTWEIVEENRTTHVIYLSADGTAMVMVSCLPGQAEPTCILIGKQLPISSEKIEEALHAVEQAGHQHHFSWESEATCPSA